MMEEKFRIISLELNHTFVFSSSNLQYKFVDESDSIKSIYTSLIIGPNGTGKSNLFRIIIELFKELSDLKEGKKRVNNVGGNFVLVYQIDDELFEYTNKSKFIFAGGNPVRLERNGERISFAAVKIPKAIIASSIMLTDKYPFYKQERDKNNNKIEAFSEYKYLGVRNIAQNASTRAYVRRTVEYIVSEFQSDYLRRGLLKSS